MSADPHDIGAKPPLVLGATGRIGIGFQQLTRLGLWPGVPPVWQARNSIRPSGPDRLDWDILVGATPAIGQYGGIINLAGVVSGNLGLNTDLALAAIELARATGCGPVLLTSSAAVYGVTDSSVTEDAACNPVNDYGRAKLAMEHAVAARLQELGDAAPVVCILRIGNVAGADALLTAAARGPVALDQFEDGSGPERSYIGMLGLARIIVQLIALAARSAPLPPVLNIATSRPIQMTDMLQAAGLTWRWRPAPDHTLRRMALDTARLDDLIAPDPLSADPLEIIRQACLAGWAPA